jgi:general secretion pathway protein D
LKTFTGLIGIACLCVAVAYGADITPSETASASAPRPGEVNLRALLRELGPRLAKHFVWDPSIPESIDLGNLNGREMSYPELLGLLAVNRMAVVAGDKLWLVIPISDIRQVATPLVAPGSIKALDDEWVTTVVPVRNIPSTQLVPLLRPMVPSSGQLVALPDRNALILVDRGANVKRMIEIIKLLEDMPKSPDQAAPKTP